MMTHKTVFKMYEGGLLAMVVLAVKRDKLVWLYNNLFFSPEEG